jgi:hypothetical protein
MHHKLTTKTAKLMNLAFNNLGRIRLVVPAILNLFRVSGFRFRDSDARGLAVAIQLKDRIALTPALSPRRGSPVGSAGQQPPLGEAPRIQAVSQFEPENPCSSVFIRGCLSVALLCLFVAAGCKSWTPSPCISPRIEGRVVDADTHQPLAKVKITVNPGAKLDTGESPRGAQSISRERAIATDRDGKFVLDSEHDLVLLRRVTWYSVTLAFDRDGYDRLLKNFTLADVGTNSPTREPLIQTGDIPLQRSSP